MASSVALRSTLGIIPTLPPDQPQKQGVACLPKRASRNPARLARNRANVKITNLSFGHIQLETWGFCVGLFKRRIKEPVAVGNSWTALTDSGQAFIAQQHHKTLSAEAISAIAPVTWALWMAGGFASREPAAGRAWLREVLDHGDPHSLSSAVNAGGILRYEPGQVDDSLQFVAIAIGKFWLSPESKLYGTWQFEGPADPDRDATPVLGSLLTLAEQYSTGSTIWYALEMLAEANLDFDNPAVFTELPDQLLSYGARQTALDDLGNGFT